MRCLTRLLREEPDLDIWEIFRNYYPYFLRGTVTTVIVSLITVLFGFILGCVIALMRMSRSKLLSAFGKEQTLDLTDLVLDPKKGRQSDDQFVYCSALGLGALDIMISYEMYLKAKAEGIGTVLKMYDKPLWE